MPEGCNRSTRCVQRSVNGMQTQGLTQRTQRGKAATKCLTADGTDDTDKECKEQPKEIIRGIRAIRGHKGPQNLRRMQRI